MISSMWIRPSRTDSVPLAISRMLFRDRSRVGQGQISYYGCLNFCRWIGQQLLIFSVFLDRSSQAPLLLGSVLSPNVWKCGPYDMEVRIVYAVDLRDLHPPM